MTSLLEPVVHEDHDDPCQQDHDDADYYVNNRLLSRFFGGVVPSGDYQADTGVNYEGNRQNQNKVQNFGYYCSYGTHKIGR